MRHAIVGLAMLLLAGRAGVLAGQRTMQIQ